jgi:hypothetical protein
MPQHSALRSLRVSVTAWVVEAGSVEQAAKERGLTAKMTALQLFFRGLNLMSHKGPQAIESAVTATRRHLDRALPINTSNPRSTNFTIGWSRRI